MLQLSTCAPVGKHVPTTFAELLLNVSGDSDLPESRRRSVCTSIRCFGRLLGQDLGTMPVELGAYRTILAEFSPRRAGIKHSRWSNIRSDILFALRYAGVPAVPGRSMTPPSRKWAALLDLLGTSPSRYILPRFARHCTERGIEPGELDYGVIESFRVALEEASFADNVTRTVRHVIRAWNHAASHIEGWPDTQLALPPHPRRWTLPLSAYPQQLQEELQGCFARAATEDLFSHPIFQARRTSTVEGWRYQMRAYLGALVVRGHHPATLRTLAQLVEPEIAKTGLRYLVERSAERNRTRAHRVACLLVLLARDFLHVSAGQLEQLEYLCRCLTPKGGAGLTKKNRERLRPFDDPRHVGALLNLPQALLRHARREDHGRRRDVVEVQIALAIELLLMTTMRIGNLASLRIDRHLSFTRAARDGVVHVAIPVEEVKNGEALEFELPAETAKLLKTYLTYYRPRLTGKASPWLFPGRLADNHKHSRVLASQISGAIWKCLGLRVHPHLFRHLCAKLFLEANPGAYDLMRRVFGHRSTITITRYYTGTEMAAAVRHYDQHILRLRHSLPGAV
jgi:integrase